ncbi:MAG: hypothetical protein ACLFMU_07955 [Bacteroidales bacterium]
MKKENRHIIQQELSELGSTLGRHAPDKEQSEFRVPDDYFAKLPSMVQEEVLQRRVSQSSSVVKLVYRRVIPVVSVVILLAAVTLGLFFFEGNDTDSALALEDYPELQYLANQPDFDEGLLENAVLESDLTVDEILYGLDYGLTEGELTGNEIEDYDELMEDIFEKSQYYGMESREMLSYLE